METLFWVALAVLFYTYVGYGVLLLLLNAFRKKRPPFPHFTPPLTLVIPAYNEADCIEQKIENSLSLAYPPGNLFIVVVTDGSTDGTPQIVQRYGQIALMHLPQRRGKTAALNRAMQGAQTPYVVFTDANTLLSKNSLLDMMRHYADPATGGVSGEKRVANGSASPVGWGEGLYWQYESALKKASADFYTVVGAAGELFSVRTELFKPVPEDTILDDFAASVAVCTQGYRVAYEAAAVAAEPPSLNAAEERKRKVRISAGCFQALVRYKHLLNPWRNPRLAFQAFSHRVLRWVACPLALPLLLFCSGWLWAHNGGLFYTVAFFAQCLFYALAAGGRLVANKNAAGLLLLLPYYFVFMNACVYAGFVRFVQKRQSVLWEKAVRRPLKKNAEKSHQTERNF